MSGLLTFNSGDFFDQQISNLLFLGYFRIGFKAIRKIWQPWRTFKRRFKTSSTPSNCQLSIRSFLRTLDPAGYTGFWICKPAIAEPNAANRRCSTKTKFTIQKQGRNGLNLAFYLCIWHYNLSLFSLCYTGSVANGALRLSI